MPFTHVDTPIVIGGATIRNRVFRSGHGTGLALGGITDDFVEYHTARARGGVGLSILEILSVHDTSPGFMPAYATPGMDDGYRRLVDRNAPLGMALFQQLWHGGANVVTYGGAPTYSASDVPSPFWIGAPPVPMTKLMIGDIVGCFADAAARLEAWGIQGAEVHAGHNYLVQQFLQPSTNRRTDEYGGSLENRMRLLVEILSAVRAAVSPAFALGVRVGTSRDGGVDDAEELADVVRALETRHLIDFVDVTFGGYYYLHDNIAGMDQPTGHQLAGNAPIRAASSVPVLAIGRFRTLEEADQAIRVGEADMIGLTRATIADPYLVAKSLAGRIEEVRPCIACLQDCLGGLMTTHRLGCTVNPAVGHEARLAEDVIGTSLSPRRVAVIGGGPAGLEAARIAALRGHKVILFEAESRLGGAIKYAARAPSREGIADITTWLEAEVFRLGVDVRLSSFVDADDVIAESPDVVIVAAGATPRLDGVSAQAPGAPIVGIDHSTVTSSYNLFNGEPLVGLRHAVVIDDTGHYEPIACAEHLLAHGLKVTMVTRFPSFGAMLENTFQNPAHLRRLTRAGHFRHIVRSRAVRIDADGVTIVPIFVDPGANDASVLPADKVVVITANAANGDVFWELERRHVPVTRVGDALSPRYLGVAISEGRAAALAIEMMGESVS